MTKADEKREEAEALYRSGSLFHAVSFAKSAPNLEPIWGNWLFKQCIVEEVGEPGLSKTTLNFAFVSSLLNNQSFLGVNGKMADVGWVLYLDLESSHSLIKARNNMLDVPDNDNFIYCNHFGVALTDLESCIDMEVEEKRKKGLSLGILFVDPIRAAFRTRDENDNAEASIQMAYLRTLSQKWGCAIVIVHHSSKAELSGTRKGSGAYARAALSDIIWNFEKLGEDYDPDLFKFHIPKSRYIQDDFCICIRKGEGRFEVVDFPAGYKVYSSGTRIYSLQQALDIIMQDEEPREPHEMLAELDKIGQRPSRAGLYKAITAMIQLGALQRMEYGHYVYVPPV